MAKHNSEKDIWLIIGNEKTGAFVWLGAVGFALYVRGNVQGRRAYVLELTLRSDAAARLKLISHRPPFSFHQTGGPKVYDVTKYLDEHPVSSHSSLCARLCTISCDSSTITTTRRDATRQSASH